MESPRRWLRSLRRDWRFWLGLVLGLACLVWLGYSVDWQEVRTALWMMDYRWALIAAVLNLASVPLRTLRWRIMFRTYAAPSFWDLTRAMLIGQAVNVWTPAPRLGDLVRATVVGRGRITYVLGTLVVELTLNTLMLAALVLLLLWQVPWPAAWRGSGEALLVTAAAALAVVTLVVLARHSLARVLDGLHSRWSSPLVQRVLRAAHQILLSLDVLGGPALFLSLACSALIWAMYTAVNYVLLKAVLPQPSMVQALFLLAVLQLGVAVPSSPGRVGVYHYLCIQALAVFGVPYGVALSYAIVLHLISVVMPLALGGALAWQLGVSLRPRTEAQES